MSADRSASCPCGSRKFFYDVWGDAVNLAARMEQTGLPDRVHIAASTARLLQGAIELEPRGTLAVKGMGEMETFFVRGTPAHVADDQAFS